MCDGEEVHVGLVSETILAVVADVGDAALVVEEFLSDRLVIFPQCLDDLLIRHILNHRLFFAKIHFFLISG